MIVIAKQKEYRPVLNRQVLTALRPRPPVKAWEWINQHGRDAKGRLFDGDKVPHFRGVCEAWDDPAIRKIVLMFGTRLVKTLGSHELMACAMATNPMPGIYGTATDKLAKRTVREKIYKILEQITATRWQLLPEKFRSTSEIRLADSTWVVAYSGSETLLADWPGFYGIGNEIDKWDKSVSDEGDTLAQFLERFKDSPSHKILLECSPSVKGHSRIEAEYLTSDQRRYHVPCPHCRHHQVLRLGSGKPGEGGLKWDKLPDGHNDPDLAERTARYICESCHKAIHDHHRPRMMRLGVWAPKGCSVDKRGRVVGKPDRAGSVAGFQLSSLYSLQLTWGRVASAFVTMKRSPKTLQMFINGWLSETWEPHRVKSEPEDVAERLSTADAIGVMPAWATWLFAAVDVQAEYFKWLLVAAGPGERAAIIDRAACDTWDEVYEQCVNRAVQHADGGTALLPCLTLIDSAHKTEEVYKQSRAWSRADRLVIPCKGANTDMAGEPYQKVTIGDGTKRGSRIQRRQALKFSGVVRIRVNAFYYEPIIERWLASRSPDTAGSLGVPAELAHDADFMREICNAAMSDEPSKMDPDRLLWVKRWESEPNDFRDCLKYARCAMDVKFRGNWRTAERRQVAAAIRPVEQAAQQQPRGDGEVYEGRRHRLRNRPRRERAVRR
jgi:phage terminase large subunit GpA-like protein